MTDLASKKIHQALQHLLPTGYAWPRDPDSVLMRVLLGMAASLAELDALTTQATEEWQPAITRTRIAEWEEAVGLPDSCGLDDPSFEERRAAVLLRLRSIKGFYDDSSPAAPAAIEAIAAEYGFPAKVRYNTPFRVGRDRASQRLGQLDGVLHLFLDGPSDPFRCGVDRVGSRLFKRPRGAVVLGCYLQRHLPARFELRFYFSQDTLPGDASDVFRVQLDRVGTRLVKLVPSST